MYNRTRRQYSDEFKAEAVALVEQQGYGLMEAARRLGIDRSKWQRWRQEQAGQAKPARYDTEADRELKRLREEVRKLRMERDILKKRRPSSPTSRAEIRVHRGGEGELSGECALLGHGGFAQWLLRLAPTWRWWPSAPALARASPHY